MKQEISILINGKEKNFNKDKTADNQEHAQSEVAAAIETVNRDGYTILAAPVKKTDHFLKKRNWHVFSHKKTSFPMPQKNKTLSKQILAAVMGAVVTGTILGVFVLMVFSSDITEAGDKQVEAPVVKTEQPANNEKSVALTPIKLEFSALQAGVFSSKERAEGVVKSIEENGFSAVIVKTDEEKYSVIVGMGNEKHQLDKYNEAYQKKMDKPLSKTLSFTFENLKTPNNLDEIYFKNGQVLLQNVLTLSQMPEAKGSGLDRTLNDFNKWKEYGNNQKGKWKENTAKASSDFEKQLEGAFLALKDSKKGEINWAFQQKVMDSFQAYTNLLSTLK
ncbi:SPOR domain-containing protein [Fictibacillus sp. b24]|uniref:SPOR domain-containing protein n=1 Tax=Fictibacillus sp. b24 TaxID=3055863 RepID=UPI0025A2E410|nr:SPOR domain-containing protein [Fictibacillus sp. b24]MDM5315702.1 SPOR domain-containing protein [Fictibacillus sp. b24]